jgi:heat shock protein HslJ
MLVKEDFEGDWRLFYDRIEGFDYEEGYEYELLVNEQEIEDPPADASSIKWTLVEVVSRAPALEGTKWVLDSYLSREGVLVGVLPDTQISAEFQDGQVGGNAGCNSYFGGYELGDGSLEIGMLGMTEMYCFPEEVMDQEGQYLAVLASAASYKLEGDRLEIADSEGNTVLTYSTLKPLPLVDTQWQLTSYSNGKGGVVSVLVGTEITALFSQDGHVSGTAGCNNYNAAYEVEGNRITIGPAASTMMMCPGPEGLMEQEQTYLEALESVAGYQIEGDNLQLMDSSGQVMLSYTVRESAPLVGPMWRLVAYNNGKEAVVSVLTGTEITAQFGEDGNLAGSAGCNNYNASYQVEGEAIQIGPAMSTRMYCAEPEGIMEQEAAYLAALEMAATYKIEGDRLLLHSAEGARVAEYVVKAETGLSEDVLKNMEYKSEWTQSGVAPLANGEYREQAAPGSATETVVLLSPWLASGELNGEPAMAAILITDPGGSGTFYDLAVVVERDGQPLNVALALLGDRVQINSLDIENNQIVVDMISHGPDDPMCCPTQHVIKTYELQGEELVEISS